MKTPNFLRPGLLLLPLALAACGQRGTDDEPTVRLQSALNAGNALFVVGNATLSAADNAIKTRLQGIGFTVTVKKDSVATTADASGKSLVFISSTVNSSDVNTKFRTVTVPVLCSERLLFDDQGMTGSNTWDQGTLTGQNKGFSEDPSHSLSAGLWAFEGITVTSAPSTFGWGVPNENAARIISVMDDRSHFLSFGYQTGAAMVGLTAPARRVGFFLSDTTASSLTTQGWSLFDVAVRWAAGLFPLVSMVPGDTDASEVGPNHGSFVVSRIGGDTAQPLDVVFGVAGTAANGVDYVRLTPNDDTARVVVTIPAGQTSKTVDVTVINDSEGEGLELASFNLRKDWQYDSNPSQLRATVTIADDGDAQPARGSLLFLVGNTTLNAGDAAVKNHLVALGYTVAVKAAPGSGIGDAIGKDAVLISSTVNSGDLLDTFRDCPVPVMIWESSLWDDMGMVPATSGSYGTTTTSYLSILKPEQPPAAGHKGTVTAASPSDVFRWGKPHPDNALIMASLAGDPSKATIFGYDMGVMMSGGFTPASRRLGFFLGDDTASKLTPSGWMIFDAAVKWTIGKIHDEPIDPYLATPASGNLWEMPVAIVRYIPTDDGVHLNGDYMGMEQRLSWNFDRIAAADKQIKFTLEEGSKFRGYKTPGALPSLGYRVVKMVTIYEPMPPSNWEAYPAVLPDYTSMLARIGGRELVETLGVKEIWVWGHPDGGISQPESNMSSPLTGDVSNSTRVEDLPIYNKTFLVYGYNYLMGSENAVHNHGHQLEAILSHINWTRDLPISNNRLFWERFVGQNQFGAFTGGRCGWTHMPPNTTVDYDYGNTTLVESDVEDWTPAGTGQKKLVNVDTWRSLLYAWPDGVPPGDPAGSGNFYLYWMQAHPGRDNGIRHPEADDPQLGQATLNNWWSFTGDWDAYATSGPGLVTHTPP